MIEKLLPDLTEEEQQIYRRGRNAKSYTMAKNATMHDYRKATGMEAADGISVSGGPDGAAAGAGGKGLIWIGKEKEITCDMKN